MSEKKIYQDSKGNAVFVGFDENGEAKYAARRGTLSDVQYRGDVSGSDKSYGFQMKGSEPERVYLFESAIDAMSHASLANIVRGDDNAWKIHNRLALGGVSDNALERYLDQNPNIKEIVFCLDNDKAGREATEMLGEKYYGRGYTVRNVPPKTKDYNEELGRYVQSQKPKIAEKKTQKPLTL